MITFARISIDVDSPPIRHLPDDLTSHAYQLSALTDLQSASQEVRAPMTLAP